MIVETGALMLVLENTHTRAGGTVLSPELTAELARAAQRHGAYVHLDGARLFNAAVALGVPVRGARGAGEHGGGQPEQGALRADGGDPRRPRAGDRARARDAAPARRGERAQGGHRGRRGARRARHARRAARRRPPAGARARGAAAGDPGARGRARPRSRRTSCWWTSAPRSSTRRSSCRLLAERGVLGLERDTSRIRFVTHRLIGDAEIARAAEIVAALAAEHVPADARRAGTTIFDVVAPAA